jgi:hypothetical protein
VGSDLDLALQLADAADAISLAALPHGASRSRRSPT